MHSKPNSFKGMIAACCVKSAQTVNRMRALVSEGITEKDWTEALIKKTLVTRMTILRTFMWQT